MERGSLSYSLAFQRVPRRISRATTTVIFFRSLSSSQQTKRHQISLDDSVSPLRYLLQQLSLVCICISVIVLGLCVLSITTRIVCSYSSDDARVVDRERESQQGTERFFESIFLPHFFSGSPGSMTTRRRTTTPEKSHNEMAKLAAKADLKDSSHSSMLDELLPEKGGGGGVPVNGR
jgi:hypothetical protein